MAVMGVKMEGEGGRNGRDLEVEVEVGRSKLEERVGMMGMEGKRGSQ